MLLMNGKAGAEAMRFGAARDLRAGRDGAGMARDRSGQILTQGQSLQRRGAAKSGRETSGVGACGLHGRDGNDPTAEGGA